ncbi:MAG: hypothetical protein KKE02_20195 [Alphaproteobacteria bacterium]|nr:hypothetical protein [Alphaproteobacteria bacterium]MBU1514795.1 hypothetical protein [Alphaproteobacteria bacterium]MBU2093926.1 hypothetical protein [Alphaproteobacteria bacterium]MBU2153353.1 hypothetical protein [Alphaproteobacteria bacterium]MBU2309781.1 hypothetical protein [Alphaproteobacteria bacterium]
MRTFALALLLTLPAVAAHADPVQEARSATGACLSAVIDGAPVEDIDGDDVVIRRGKDPVSCTVRVNAGEPVVLQDAVRAAIKRRAELFVPAKTRWDAGDWAFRETFCNIPGRRSLAVFISTNKPGYQPVLTATVFEVPKRDERCDRDLGLQKVAANDPAVAPEAAPVVAAKPEAAIAELSPTPPTPKKKGWRDRIPDFGLGKKD